MEGWVVLCCWSILAVVGYFIGQAKNKPLRGAIAGFLFGPVGWLLIALSANEHVSCPYCKGNIVSGARRCKNCGSHIPRCPACNKQIGLRKRSECCHYGEELTGDEWPEEGSRVRD